MKLAHVMKFFAIRTFSAEYVPFILYQEKGSGAALYAAEKQSQIMAFCHLE